MIIGAFAVSIILALLVTTNIVKPLFSVMRTLKDISEGEGDLTKRVNYSNKDVIGDLSRYFNQTMEIIKNLIISINKEAAHLSEIGSALASNMNETAAAAIEEMVANISSVTDTLVKNSANVKTLIDSSEVGKTGLHEVAEDINEIARESEGLMEINRKCA